VTTADWFKLRPKQAVRPAYSVMDTSDYTAITGREPRPWQDALNEYFRSMQMAANHG